MKKATNPKNRGKVSKLFPIMQEHLGQSMNLARSKLMALLLEALVKAQTVSPVRLIGKNRIDCLVADREFVGEHGTVYCVGDHRDLYA